MSTVQLDEQLRKLLEQFQDIPHPPSLSVAEARRISNEFDRGLVGPPVSLASVRNLTVQTQHATIPLRVYAPRNEQDLPALVYLHGGGWVVGELDSADWFWRSLAMAANCVVVSVAYRLAPEHKFPAAVEDSYWVTRWVAENGIGRLVDPNRIAVGGESAGGNLAAAVCLMARDRKGPHLAFQLLIYPVMNHFFETESYREYGEGYWLTTAEMKWYWNHYLRTELDGANPYASPLLSKDFKSLPPALVMTAEFDPLRDEGEAYAARLQKAGINTKLARYDGMIHGFLQFTELKETRAAVDEAATELRRALSSQLSLTSE